MKGLVWGKMQHGSGERLHAFRGDAVKSLCGLISRFALGDGRTTERPRAGDCCGHCKMRLTSWPEDPEVEVLREALRAIQIDAFNLGGPSGILSTVTPGNLPHRIAHAKSAAHGIHITARKALGEEHDAWAERRGE